MNTLLLAVLLSLAAVTLAGRSCTDPEGKIQPDGARFAIKCNAMCTCRDGGMGCVSMCPPYMKMGRKCREVYKVDQCCAETICKNEVVAKRCTSVRNRRSSTSKTTPRRNEAVWNARLSVCPDGSCTRTCGATILSDKWLLTAAKCLKGATSAQIKVYVGKEPEGEPTHVVKSMNVHLTDMPSGLHDLALIELVAPIVFEKSIQPANLAIAKQQCQTLTRKNCETLISGQGGSDKSKVIRTRDCKNYEKDGEQPFASLNAGKMLCVAKPTSKIGACAGDLGSGVVARQDGRNYIVGVVTMISDAEGCSKHPYVGVRDVCKQVKWIQETTELNRCSNGSNCDASWD